jgi:hypothetical protein
MNNIDIQKRVSVPLAHRLDRLLRPLQVLSPVAHDNLHRWVSPRVHFAPPEVEHANPQPFCATSGQRLAHFVGPVWPVADEGMVGEEREGEERGGAGVVQVVTFRSPLGDGDPEVEVVDALPSTPFCLGLVGSGWSGWPNGNLLKSISPPLLWPVEMAVSPSFEEPSSVLSLAASFDCWLIVSFNFYFFCG